MAAPIVANNSVSKKTLRNFILFNILIISTFICLTYFPYNGKSQIDIIFDPLSATKMLITSLLFLHIGLHVFFGSKKPKFKLGLWIKDILRCFGLFCLGVLAVHFIAVLFGAPFTQKTAETFHFAMMLTSASLGPLLIHLETNTDSWIRVVVFQSPEPGLETMAYLTCISSVVGAWLGAVPIPLDWDRPWQVWPITCVFGTLIGHCVGIILSSIYMSIQFYKGNKFKIT